ncbi:hypothetical protein WDU94_015622 [Cyamophila willieti]
MNWSFNLTYVKNKALNAINALKMISNKRWGVSRETLLRFYKAYILPILDYGSIVYGSAKDHLINKLNTVHNMGIRIATGALRSSPISSLYVESGVPSLALRRDKLMLNYISKIGASPLNPVKKLLFNRTIPVAKFTKSKPKPLCLRFRRVMDFVSQIETCDIIPYSNHTPPWIGNDSLPVIDVTLSEHKKSITAPLIYQKLFIDTLASKYPSFTLCYTDGSKSNNNTSCAYSIDDTICSSFLHPVNSVFSAELSAILSCLQALRYHPSIKFLIISDSRSSLSAMSNPPFKNPLVSKIFRTWFELKSSGKDVVFLWCPSHCGIRGNELVDNAAKNPLPTSSFIKTCTPEDFKPFISNILKKNWQTQWDSVSNTNKLKSIKPVIGKWSSSSQDKRHEEVVLTRLRIGHTRVTHSFLFTKTDPPSCQCGLPVTVRHILNCPIYAQIRSSLPCPPSLLNDSEGVKSLFIYLRNIKMYDLI